MAIDEDIRAFLEQAPATVVASRDAEMRPALARAWGLDVQADGSELTFCVGVPDGSPVQENLEGNGAIAVTFSRPSTYRTVQIKGEVLALDEPTDEQLRAADSHADAFSAEVLTLGLPADAGRRLRGEVRLISVRMRVSEMFDQTPGPGAGSRL
ncbi:MAG TPA: pyridoxamine 5'-phosphate oxidase family protein [Solirubrobacteraceae bacterium]|nr:pyridoxamine 5'-phosphate oxidase family protein [Solirubrobacteraceae bacterium]